MINPFGFVEIFGFRFHLWSFICIVSTCLIAFYLLKKIPFIHRLLISVTFCVFPVHVGLIIFAFFMNEIPPYSYIITSLFLTLVLLIMNYKYKFLGVSKVFFVLVGIQLCVYTIMVLSGHFVALKLWGTGEGQDPHGWLWVINNGLGFWMWLGLIKKKEEK